MAAVSGSPGEGSPRREDLRAGDADRQFVADRLREALEEGRLNLAEYDDRLREAYAARTYGELDRVLHDLPPVTPPDRQQLATPTATPPTGPVGRPAQRVPGWLLAAWGGWLTSSLVCFVIWVLTTPTGYPWPIWVAGPWGAVLLGRTLMAYASGDPQGYEQVRRDRDDARRERRARRRGY